jgi:hypothetical protein
MATALDQLTAKTKLQQELIDTIREQGWTVTVVPFPGAVTFGHPSNSKEIPTPDYAREPRPGGNIMTAMYPFESYHVLHQITILYSVIGDVTETEIPIKIGTVFRREASAPWVTSREHSVGLRAAIDFVKAPHPADDAAAPVVTTDPTFPGRES